MPKTALPSSERCKRLFALTNGEFQFRPGMKPPSDSHWAREILKIEQCSRHKNRQGLDPFGGKVHCTCGYHFYYLAGEYMDCNACNDTFVSWDNRMLEQLSDGVRARFPVVLTRKYACDQSVVTFLRSRTLGNSSTVLRNQLEEVHSEVVAVKRRHFTP